MYVSDTSMQTNSSLTLILFVLFADHFIFIYDYSQVRLKMRMQVAVGYMLCCEPAVEAVYALYVALLNLCCPVFLVAHLY